MRIKVEKNDLQKAIQAMEGIISARNAMMILSNVLIEAQEGEIRLTTTDLEIGIKASLEGEVLNEGSITIPVKKFSSIIKSLNSGLVEIEVESNQMVSIVSSPNIKFNILGIAGKEFPYKVAIPDIGLFKVEQKIFREMIQKTFYAVANDETKFVFNGIFVEYTENKLKFVATDGRRLALIQKEIAGGEIELEEGLIIPSKVIAELQKILTNEGAIFFNISKNQIFFRLSNIEISSRLIQGKFPDYEKVIPASPAKEALINRDQIEEAVRRVSLMASETSHQVKFKLSKDQLAIDAQTPDLGDAHEELEIKYSGEETVIGFNSLYILDSIREIEAGEIQFKFSDSNLPAILSSPGDKDYLSVVMPLKV